VFCLRKMLIFHLEDAIKYQVENGRFDIECVAQYPQNTRERLLKEKLRLQHKQLDPVELTILWPKIATLFIGGV